jgi:hypothetical protein
VTARAVEAACDLRQNEGDDMDDKTLLDLFGSLSREIGDIKDGIQRIEARLTRHGGIINGGARQIARLVTWSEEVDEMLAERDGRIAELERRLSRLENGKRES